MPTTATPVIPLWSRPAISCSTRRFVAPAKPTPAATTAARGPVRPTSATLTSSYKYAVVYQTIHPLEDSYDFEGMVEAGELHSKLSQKLSSYFDTLDFPKKLHLAAGGCRVCPVCAKRTMEPCRHPDRALASLEAYGVNVSALARAGGMKYTNGQNTVTYFGALFFTPAECEG